MKKNSTGLIGVYTLLGAICGMALAMLLQPGEAAAHAQAIQTSNGSGKSVAAAAVLSNKSFTYQGVLRQSGQPVNGSCDLQFGLWEALDGGHQLGTNQTITSTISNGLFTVLLNDTGQFGDTAFDGEARWIETNVRCPAGSGEYTLLTPRQALTAAPLASGLVPHANLYADDSSGFGDPALAIHAPAVVNYNPLGLKVEAGGHSYEVTEYDPIGIWGDTVTGIGVQGTTNTGIGIRGSALDAGGVAGHFDGDVEVTGNLNVTRWQTLVVLDAVGPLPLTSARFFTNGGKLLLFYNGSGFSSPTGGMIGMTVKLDGIYVAGQTGIFANNANIHQAFVSKEFLMTNIGRGYHTITLDYLNPSTFSDSNDIFQVTLEELPY
jgi:hypothetical protein